MPEVKAFGLTDRGLARPHNEDYFEIDSDQNLFLVADGMGGHRHGEVASQLAVRTIKDFVDKTANPETTWPFVPEPELRRPTNILKMAVRLAHDRVMYAIREDRRLFGMGTTVVGLLLEDGFAAIAHVGDSRAYRLRDGNLELLTDDHTWVNEQVVAGFLSADQARVHPLKNVVTRALGGEREVAVDIKEVEVESGDLFILCSDGLTTMLSDEEILAGAQSSTSLDEICHNLVDAANSRGGHDNVTVVALGIEG
ncbi:MAG: Stp1/IreP family PP2C-type Ser/Thr phosphatase [Acidobacteriota bacterium]